jgi:serine/threonine-protein kinase
LVIEVPASERLATNLQLDLFQPLAISPDGTQVVYAATDPNVSQVNPAACPRCPSALELYLRRIGEFAAEPIAGSEGGFDPIFSPDGQWIAFNRGDGLYKLSVTGGAPQSIVEGPGARQGATWGDNTIVYATSNGLMKVAATGGAPEPVGWREGEAGDPLYWPAFLPGTEHVLVTRRATSTIALVDTATGQLDDLGIAGSHARYLPTGHIVYAFGDGLFAVPFDLATLATSGTPVPVLSDVSNGAAGVSRFAVAGETGALIYLPATGGNRRRLVWVDRSGNPTPLLEEERDYETPRVSPQGDRIAFTSSDRDGVRNVWIAELRTNSLARLTVAGNGTEPLWSPDGEWVYFASSRDSDFEFDTDIFRRKADFTGSAEKVLTRGTGQWPLAASADGLITAVEFQPETSWDIIAFSTDGQEVQSVVATPAAEAPHALSPDGKWLAYMSDETGAWEVYAQPFPEGGRRVTVSTGGGVHPLWSPDSQVLYYRQGTSMVAVDVITEPEFDHGPPSKLFDVEIYDEGNRQFDISPDGEQFLMIETDQGGGTAAQRINVILNWFEELKELVPAGR